MSSTVLVTDVDRGSGLTIVRSLGRQGYRVVAASAQQQAIGFYSRYTSVKFVYPNPRENAEAFISSLLTCVEQHKVDLIIPATDEVILPLSENRERFAGRCQIAIAEPQQMDVVNNKMKTVRLAEELRIPVPKTYLVSSAAETQAIAPQLTYPVVLKPMRSRIYIEGKGIQSFTVQYAHDEQHLLAQQAVFDGLCDVLLQEYHAGSGEGVELLLHEGKPICAFQHKRLHEVPITGGASALRESVALDPQLYDYAVRILGTLNWTGLAMVEFKVSDGQAYLMEINGRVWGSLPLAYHSGMDFPAYLADLYLDPAFSILEEPLTAYQIGLKARNVGLDLVWVLSVLRGSKHPDVIHHPRRIAAVAGVAAFLNPFYRSDALSWQDPLPGLAEIPQIVKHVTRKLIDR